MKKLEINKIQIPDVYSACNDLGIVTSYFNPNNYKTKLKNYYIFEEILRKSNLSFVTVECTFTGKNFTLKSSSNVLQITSPHVMWQKERLLNIGIKSLPNSVKKVAWLDCDILFSNPDWAIQTSRMLDRFLVVQLFQKAIRLPQDHRLYNGQGKCIESFGYIKAIKKNLVLKGNDCCHHGHTGFAWAARRDLLEKHGLYDACILGGGDHVMAHAMCGDFSSGYIEQLVTASPSESIGYKLNIEILMQLIRKIFPRSFKHWIKKQFFSERKDSDFKSHLKAWGEGFYRNVQGKIGYTPGVILHLWHGDGSNRLYVERKDELRKNDFNPVEDLRIGNNGSWEWNSDKPKFHQYVKDYFYCRKEDGVVNSLDPNL